MFDLTLYRLLVLRMVVEEQSFSGTAARLGITQPAVSAHVKALEDQAGLKVLERRPGHGVVPTEAGRILFEYAREVTMNAADIMRVIKEFRTAAVGTVVIGASGTLGKHVLPPLMADFKRHHPGVHMVLRTGTKDVVVNHVARGEVDFGLVLTMGETPGMDSLHLANEEVVLVVAPEHPLATKPAVEAADLAAVGFLSGIRHSAHQQMIETRLAELGIHIQQVLMELEDADALKAVAKSGLGVGALLHCSVANELAAGTLVRLPFAAPPTWIEVRMLQRPRKRFSPATQQFVAFLRRHLADRPQMGSEPGQPPSRPRTGPGRPPVRHSAPVPRTR